MQRCKIAQTWHCDSRSASLLLRTILGILLPTIDTSKTRSTYASRLGCRYRGSSLAIATHLPWLYMVVLLNVGVTFERTSPSRRRGLSATTCTGETGLRLNDVVGYAELKSLAPLGTDMSGRVRLVVQFCRISDLSLAWFVTSSIWQRFRTIGVRIRRWRAMGNAGGGTVCCAPLRYK